MVIPHGHNGAQDILTAIFSIADPAVIDSHNVSEQIKMIRIAELAVYGRDSRLGLAHIAPNLSYVNLSGSIFTTRAPRDRFLALRAHQSHHFRNKVRIREMYLVCADVEIWLFREQIARLGKKFLNDSLAFRTLHITPECSGERLAVTRHIYLRNHKNMMLAAEIEKLPDLFLGIAASRVTGHILRGGKLRINLAFKPPGLILSQMPMESVDLIERKDLYLALDFLQAYVRASRVVHKATDSERGPVYDFTARDSDLTS